MADPSSWADTAGADDEMSDEMSLDDPIVEGIEVVERQTPGGGFHHNDQHGHDSFAMEDASDEVVFDPRLNQRGEPATELIDRDALIAFAQAEEDAPTLGVSLPPATIDAATVDLADPAVRQTFVPLEAVPADTLGMPVPGDMPPLAPAAGARSGVLDRPHLRTPVGGPHPRTPVGGPHPRTPVGGPHPRTPVGGPHPRTPVRGPDPSTEVIAREGVPYEALSEATVPTQLPTLEEIEAVAFLPHHPVDHGHDELSMPRPQLEPEPVDTPDALALPPPEPGEDSTAFPLPSAAATLHEHTVPLPTRSAVRPPPHPEAHPPPAESPALDGRMPGSPAQDGPLAGPPAPDGRSEPGAPLVALDQDLVAEGTPPERGAVDPVRVPARDPELPAVSPMVGLLALIGSGGVLAVVVVGAGVVAVVAVLVLTWTPSDPPPTPLPPIELPAREPAAVPPPPAQPEPDPAEGAAPAEGRPSGGTRRHAAPEPVPEPVFEPEPEPVVVPPPAPPAPLPDLDGDDDDGDDGKKRGLFRRRKD